MTTETTKGDQVLVHCYCADRDVYLVSMVPDNDAAEADKTVLPLSSRRRSSVTSLVVATLSDYVEVATADLKPAPSAKFYPVLETLMVRGEQTASAAEQLMTDAKTKQFLDDTGRTIQNQVNRLVAEESTAQGHLADLTAQVDVPEVESNIKEVLKLVKDEELTDLLENAKERLQQLVQTDLSAASQAALAKTGIRIDTDAFTANSFTESMEKSRLVALQAVEQLLEQAHVDKADLEKVRVDLSTQFATAFDSLATAAKSDRSLNEAFENIVSKTSEWQEATGRLWQTRSASLFLEGATRLQARAAAIFKGSQMQWTGEIGSKLTKSFTEGDAALARLKSIELGDVVKNRLVEAIEVRSESLGGLDGIIAGALTTVKSKGGESGDQLRDMLTGLQTKASTISVDAHETLISVLSSRSQYQDVALLQIENVLCSLESQFGDELSPEDIAAIARGEGGTAKLFEPIAKRAMKEIENQLDVAETHVSDKTVLEVLKRVRKIVSGELNLNSVMDEVVGVLNDDSVVAAGETLMLHGENVLDVIEGASGNQAVNDALKLVEKAGITKDHVMKEFEKLDMNDLIDTAGNAVTDERARLKLLSSATDTALDFVLKILPSMPVPPFEGVNDGLVYHISNLSMQGFKVRKEDIQIELAGMRATRRQSSIRKLPSNGAMKPGLNGSQHSIGSSTGSFEIEEVHSKVKATELVIIDIRNISAVLDNAAWSFEQTYLPYLKGEGKADVKLSGGSIRLQFELRKQRKGPSPTSGWEPVLCLHDRTCSIKDVGLSLHGEGSLTWILNKLASIFKGPLRDYVVRTIVRVLSNKSGWILERLNLVLAPYWDLVMRTAKLNIVSHQDQDDSSRHLSHCILTPVQDDLVEADDNVVIKECDSKERSFVELVWRERLPLGMNLLMNDESGLLKVVDFPRGSQARSVCEKRGMNPDVFKGSTIVAVNGSEYDDQEDLFDALKDPSRPKTVRFELAESADAERVRRFVEGAGKKSGPKADNSADRVFELRDVEIQEAGDLGLEFANSLDNFGLVVKGFMEGPGGIILAAEKTGKVKLGDLLVKVNGEFSVGTGGSGRARAAELLEKAGGSRPLCLTFADNYLFGCVVDKPPGVPHAECNGGPAELLLGEKKASMSGPKRIVIEGFSDVSGQAESSGIFIGDHLVFVNGVAIGAGCRWLGVSPAPTLREVHLMLEDESSYPMGLTFARPRQSKERWSSPGREHFLSDDEADTTCVTVESLGQLGCVFQQKNSMDVVVADFEAVPGMFQRSLSDITSQSKGLLALESLNGQFVPSYASKDMVKNAVARSWKGEGRVEMWLSDDQLRAWLHGLVASG